MAEPDRVWSGPVTYFAQPPASGYDLDDLRGDPHPARPAPPPGKVERGGDVDLFWSLWFAMSSRTWHRSGGFDEAYVGYGGEDTDVGHRLAARGIDLAGSAARGPTTSSTLSAGPTTTSTSCATAGSSGTAGAAGPCAGGSPSSRSRASSYAAGTTGFAPPGYRARYD